MSITLTQPFQKFSNVIFPPRVAISSGGSFITNIFVLQKSLQTSLLQTSNYLAEFEKNIETASQICLSFLHDLRGILPEINKNLLCSFPPGVSQTWWNLTIGFYGKHLTFLSN